MESNVQSTLQHEVCKEVSVRCRAFIIHKPRGVISATIDANPRNIIRVENNPRIGERLGGEPRPTVYDIAQHAGFPTDCGLIGRLDCETSGIMLFTDHAALGSAIRDPVDEDSEFFSSPYKCKEYILQLIPSKGHDPSRFDPTALESELSEPFSFSRFGVQYTTSRAEVCFIRCWRVESLSRGQEHLGWIIEVRVVLREGKHHQIRRIARRSRFHVHSLSRVRIAKILSIESIPSPGDCRWLTSQELSTLFCAFKI